MRYRDILKENDNVEEDIKSSILDVIIPLKNQRVGEFPLSRIIDSVISNPDIMGLDITPSYIASLVRKVSGCSVHTNSSGEQVVDLSNFNATKEKNNVSQTEKDAIKQAERELE